MFHTNDEMRAEQLARAGTADAGRAMETTAAVIEMLAHEIAAGAAVNSLDRDARHRDRRGSNASSRERAKPALNSILAVQGYAPETFELSLAKFDAELAYNG